MLHEWGIHDDVSPAGPFSAEGGSSRGLVEVSRLSRTYQTEREGAVC